MLVQMCQFLIGNVRRINKEKDSEGKRIGKCQFLIGNVRQMLTHQEMKPVVVDACQFLIGNVRLKKEDIQKWQRLKILCQFLIGNVRQPYLSAVAIIILHFFPKINQFSAEKSVDTSFFIS